MTDGQRFEVLESPSKSRRIWRQRTPAREHELERDAQVYELAKARTRAESVTNRMPNTAPAGMDRPPGGFDLDGFDSRLDDPTPLITATQGRQNRGTAEEASDEMSLADYFDAGLGEGSAACLSGSDLDDYDRPRSTTMGMNESDYLWGQQPPASPYATSFGKYDRTTRLYLRTPTMDRVKRDRARTPKTAPDLSAGRSRSKDPFGSSSILSPRLSPLSRPIPRTAEPRSRRRRRKSGHRHQPFAGRPGSSNHEHVARSLSVKPIAELCAMCKGGASQRLLR